MLYDEEGRPYVEPPLLPEDVHVFNIVCDYQSIFKENVAMTKKNQELRESLSRQSGLIYAQFRVIRDQQKAIEMLIKKLRNHVEVIPASVLDIQEAVRNMMISQSHKKKTK